MSEYLILHFKIPETQSVESDIANNVIDIYHSKNQQDNGTNTNTTHKDCTKYSFDGTKITPATNVTNVDISIKSLLTVASATVASTP